MEDEGLEEEDDVSVRFLIKDFSAFHIKIIWLLTYITGSLTAVHQETVGDPGDSQAEWKWTHGTRGLR